MTGPKGWFPDPNGRPGQRYFDGQQWTEHFAPAPPPPPTSVVVNNMIASPAPSVAVAVSAGRGTNHGLHLVLSLLTCGMWLPVWLLIAIVSGSSSSSVAVAGPGGTVANTGSKNRTALIVGGVFLALVILGQAAAHPWLFVPIFLLAGAGGGFFWKQKTAKEAAERDLRERELADATAERADRENRLAQEGDPRGTHGRFMPPPDLQ